MIRQHVILWTLALGAIVCVAVALRSLEILSKRIERQGGQIEMLQGAAQMRTRYPRAARPDEQLHAALAALRAQGGARWLDTVAWQVVELGGDEAADQMHDALDRAVEDDPPAEPLADGSEILARTDRQ